jgi:hypothetical protein
LSDHDRTELAITIDRNAHQSTKRALKYRRGPGGGGERAAFIYTIVASARLNRINPETYLRDMLTKIAAGHPINRIDELMPWRMTSTTAPQPP